jgi:hypothetical protein
VADDGFTAFFQSAYPRVVGQFRLAIDLLRRARRQRRVLARLIGQREPDAELASQDRAVIEALLSTRRRGWRSGSPTRAAAAGCAAPPPPRPCSSSSAGSPSPVRCWAASRRRCSTSGWWPRTRPGPARRRPLGGSAASGGHRARAPHGPGGGLDRPGAAGRRRAGGRGGRRDRGRLRPGGQPLAAAPPEPRSHPRPRSPPGTVGHVVREPAAGLELLGRHGPGRHGRVRPPAPPGRRARRDRPVGI